MKNGPHAMYWRMWWRSWTRSRPSTGTAATITKPTVIAVRCIERRSRVRPLGTRSNTIAPPCARGAWNVSPPSTSPRRVFGSVQKNPSHPAGLTSRTVPQVSAGSEREPLGWSGGPRAQGYPEPVMADRSRPNGGARLEIPPIATELGERFRLARRELYLVGGVVRDLLLGRELGGDLDFATDALPRETTNVLRGWAERLYLVGVKFGTVGARKADQVLEITTFREEVYAEEHRRPAVTFGKDLRTDLSRRDFTVNAMAIRLPDGEFLDPFGGVKDLAAKRLDTPLDPEVAFSDDPLRMLRAARFAAQLGLVPAPRVV